MFASLCQAYLHMNTSLSPASWLQRLLAKGIDGLISGLIFSILFVTIVAIWFVVSPELAQAHTTFNTGLVTEKNMESDTIFDFWIYAADWDQTCAFAGQAYQNACLTVVAFNQQIAHVAALMAIAVWIGYTLVPVSTPAQATLGKYLIGIKVIGIDRTNISFLQSFTRELFAGIRLIALAVLPAFGSLAGFVSTLETWIFVESYWAIISRRRQAVHDIIAQTRVVQTSSKQK